MVQNQLSKRLTLKKEHKISSQWCHSRKLVNGATKGEKKILEKNIPIIIGFHSLLIDI